MATLTFSYDTGSITLAEIINNTALDWGYPEFVPDPGNPGEVIPNPQTKAAFCKAVVKQIIVTAYKNGKRKSAYDQAEATLPDIELGD